MSSLLVNIIGAIIVLALLITNVGLGIAAGLFFGIVAIRMGRRS